MELNFFFIKFTNGVLTIVDVGRDVTRNNVLQIKEFYGELTQVANNLEKQRNKKKEEETKNPWIYQKVEVMSLYCGYDAHC
jgi:hypothetical protein